AEARLDVNPSWVSWDSLDFKREFAYRLRQNSLDQGIGSLGAVARIRRMLKHKVYNGGGGGTLDLTTGERRGLVLIPEMSFIDPAGTPLPFNDPRVRELSRLHYRLIKEELG